MGADDQYGDEIGGGQEAVLLADIIQQQRLYPVFQPVVDLGSGESLGYEALIRGPRNTPLHAPSHLFNAAIRHRLLHQLEPLCRRCSLESFVDQALAGKLFLNVSASLLSTPEQRHTVIAELMQTPGIAPDDIVIELSEQHPFDHHSLTHTTVERFRQLGFHIAIDDLGTGYSGLKLWAELQPDYVKIDTHFVRGIDRDVIKQAFVRSICNIGHRLQCHIIAEGIETAAELRQLQAMGVRYGQGVHLGPPVSRPPLRVCRGDSQGRSMTFWSMQRVTARVLVRTVPTVSPQSTLAEVSDVFSALPEICAIPVLVDGEPAGIVRRADLLELFSTQYGRALYEQKPVLRLMHRDALVVDCDTPLERVSCMITEQDESALRRQEMIIVQDGCYLGMASVRDLLRRITELKIRNAHHSNPLTLLPDNVPINREIDRLLQNTVDFHVASFDLNHFKSFNDCYGYSRGNQVICQLGSLLASHICSEMDCLGHSGGDNFVVLFRSRDWRARCERILVAFERRLQELYKARELAAGGIWSQDCNDQPAFFPLLSLAIGVVHPDPYKCSGYSEVAELAAEAKKQAQQQNGNAIFLSARRHLGPLRPGESPLDA